MVSYSSAHCFFRIPNADRELSIHFHETDWSKKFRRSTWPKVRQSANSIGAMIGGIVVIP